MTDSNKIQTNLLNEQTILKRTDLLKTKQGTHEQVETQSIGTYSPQIIGTKPSSGKSTFTANDLLQMKLPAPAKTVLTFDILVLNRLSIGRWDPGSGSRPDIDLVSMGFGDHGISRQHALLTCKDNQLFVRDLGSTNGTFLNGEHLTVNKSRVIHNGDKLQFGNVVINIRFAQKPAS